MQKQSAKPWYREPWPWILAAGPVIAVVAGLYTYRLAVLSSDGLVAEDYYKQGLAAGKTIAQSDKAVAMGLKAHIRVAPESLAVRLSADNNFTRPASLKATLSHPTRAGMDQTAELLPSAEGYIARLRMPESGHWLLLIEDQEKSWRVLGNLILPLNGEVVLGLRGNDTAATAK
jgi:hypothetical protein